MSYSDLQSKSLLSDRRSSGFPPTASSRTSVTVFLFEARDVASKDRNGLSDPFCKFRLGAEKFRSRVIKKTLNPEWMEQFHVFLPDKQSMILEIGLWDYDRALRNEVIGKAQLDLEPLVDGRTHDVWVDVKEKGLKRGSVHLSVLIHETAEANDFLSPVRSHPMDFQRQFSELPPESQPVVRERADRGYIGSVKVTVARITNLTTSDSDESQEKTVYCVLNLGLIRFQTFTVRKCANPEWNCEYQFPIADLHDVLEIVVMDRDPRGRTNFLGALAIPLVSMDGEARGDSFFLKDKKLLKSTKAAICLEMHLEYDLVRAAYRTLRPKEDSPSELDKKISGQGKMLLLAASIPTLISLIDSILLHKVSQIRKVITLASDALRFARGLLTWESPSLSAAAYIAYVVTVYFFQLFWIPVFLLLLFVKGYVESHSDVPPVSEEDEDDFETMSTKPSVSSETSSVAKFSTADEFLQLIPSSLNPTKYLSRFFKKDSDLNIVANVRTAHDQARFVQLILEFFAEQYEKLQNTFNFTVPWLTYFAILILLIVLIVFYVVPLRAIMIVWGTYEFAKGFCGCSNFEPLAFLSRVHTKHESKMYTQVRTRA